VRVRPSFPTPALLVVLSLASSVAGGCRSAQEFRLEADEEVYALVRDRRARLFDETDDFDIDPPEDSLRERILRREVRELPGLDMVGCLEIAAENNREFQTRKEALYLAALDVTLERWELGWIADGVGDVGISGLGDTANSAGAGGTLGLQRVLGTGAEFLGELGLALAKDLSGGGGWTATTTVDLLFTQPLLRGAGGWIVYEDLTQAERDLVYEVRAFERFRRELAVDVAARLLRLLQALDRIDNERRNFENVTKIRERNESLSNAGRLSDIQVDQALQDELSSEDRLISAHQSYENELDTFKLTLGLPMDLEISLDPGELERLTTLGSAFDDIDSVLAAEVAYSQRPDFKTSVDRVVDAERRSRVAADALRMGLDVSSSIELSSDDKNPLKFNFQDVSWSLGLVIDLPINRMRERNTYRSALIQWQASARAAGAFEDEIARDLRAELRAVAARRESREIQSSAVRLAEKRVESAGLNLQAGRASTRDLLEAQDDLVNSRNAETRALIELTLARFDLALDMGLLRVEEGGVRVETIDVALEALPGEVSE